MSGAEEATSCASDALSTVLRGRPAKARRSSAKAEYNPEDGLI
jgi:hypothetical protein